MVGGVFVVPAKNPYRVTVESHQETPLELNDDADADDATEGGGDKKRDSENTL